MKPANFSNIYSQKNRRMLRVCAWCGKVQKTDGTWEMPAAPARETPRLTLTHGICPVCAEKALAANGLGKAGGSGQGTGRKR